MVVVVVAGEVQAEVDGEEEVGDPMAAAAARVGVVMEEGAVAEEIDGDNSGAECVGGSMRLH